MHRIILSLAVVAAVAGCANPLKNVPKLQDVDIDTSAGQADALAAPINDAVSEAVLPAVPVPDAAVEKPKGGLLGFLGRKADAAKAAEVPLIVQAEPSEDAAQVALEPTAETPADVPGVAAADTPAAPEAASEAPVVLAALPAEPAATPKKKRGLFAGLGAAGAGGKSKSSKGPKPGDPDYEQVALGTSLPYGRIARVCGATPAQLGRKASTWPERGRGYTLYDSAPSSTGQRTFYLTGFDDGCARQFTAALVLFASPESYELIHYGPAGKTLPVSETDRMYEKVKSKVCRVGSGKPCGPKMKKLAKDTVFVTVYERFGGSPRWKNLLLHDGKVVALDVKG